MELKPLSVDEHNAFYTAFSGRATFLQSSTWGTFRSALSEDNHAFGVYKKSELIGIVQGQVVRARRGTLFQVGHGPLLLDEKDLRPVLQLLVAHARGLKCDVLRVCPLVPNALKNTFTSLGFRDAAPYMVCPSRTLVLPVQQSDDAILAQMKKSMRYEMRQIEKSNIEVTAGGLELLDTFWELHEATVARQRFNPFSRRSTELEMQTFGTDARIFVARIDGVPKAASLILFDAHAGYYHQGASVRDKRPVAHATLLAAIHEARERGCSHFNFWGLSEVENRAHPWWGLSRFKRGFGGEEHEYVHAQDFGLTWKYAITRAVERYRRWRRGY